MKTSSEDTVYGLDIIKHAGLSSLHSKTFQVSYGFDYKFITMLNIIDFIQNTKKMYLFMNNVNNKTLDI